jgi:hypothetical protein
MCRAWAPQSVAERVAPPPAPPREPDAAARVGDRERDLVSNELRAHFTAGRIGVDEFSDRLDLALRAANEADLAIALRGLPAVPGSPRPWDRPGTFPEWDGRRVLRPSRRPVAIGAAYAHLRSFLTVMAVLIVVWALTGMGYFWPIWPLVFWGFFAVRHAWWAYQRERATRWT